MQWLTSSRLHWSQQPDSCLISLLPPVILSLGAEEGCETFVTSDQFCAWSLTDASNSRTVMAPTGWINSSSALQMSWYPAYQYHLSVIQTAHSGRCTTKNINKNASSPLRFFFHLWLSSFVKLNKVKFAQMPQVALEFMEIYQRWCLSSLHSSSSCHSLDAVVPCSKTGACWGSMPSLFLPFSS